MREMEREGERRVDEELQAGCGVCVCAWIYMCVRGIGSNEGFLSLAPLLGMECCY